MTMDELALITALIAVVALTSVVARVVRRLHGRHVVTCPETAGPATVALDLPYSTVGAVLGRTQLRLRDCSLWPERARCGQQCLGEMEGMAESKAPAKVGRR